MSVPVFDLARIDGRLPGAFEVGAVKVTVDPEMIRAAQAFQMYSSVGVALAQEYGRAYDELGTLAAVMAEGEERAVALLFEQAKVLVTDLVNRDVMAYNVDSFMQRAAQEQCFAPFEAAFEEVSDQAADIADSEAARDEIRRNRQESRLQLEGGGFGIAGAAKGIATAAAFNLGTKALVGAFNLAGKAWSSLANRSKAAAIYQESRSGLVGGFCQVVVRMYSTYLAVLREHGLTNVQGYDYLVSRADAADAKFQNVKMLSGIAPEKRAAILSDCICTYPLESDYYRELLAGEGKDLRSIISVLAFAKHYCPEVQEDDQVVGRFSKLFVDAFRAGDQERMDKVAKVVGAVLAEPAQQGVRQASQKSLLGQVDSLPANEQIAVLERALQQALLEGVALREKVADLRVTALQDQLLVHWNAGEFDPIATLIAQARQGMPPVKVDGVTAVFEKKAMAVLADGGLPVAYRQDFYRKVLVTGLLSHERQVAVAKRLELDAKAAEAKQAKTGPLKAASGPLKPPAQSASGTSGKRSAAGVTGEDADDEAVTASQTGTPGGTSAHSDRLARKSQLFAVLLGTFLTPIGMYLYTGSSHRLGLYFVAFIGSIVAIAALDGTSFPAVILIAFVVFHVWCVVNETKRIGRAKGGG